MSRRSGRAAGALLAILACVLTAVSCGNSHSEASRAAQAFATAMSSQDVQAASSLTTSPSQAADALSSSFAGMHARTVDSQVVDAIEYSDGTGSFRLRTTWRWAEDREFTNVTNGALRRLSTGWRVQWEPALLNTGMPVGGSLQMVRTDAVPAPTVRNAAGRPFMKMQPVNDIIINPAATRNLQRSVNALAAAIKPIAPLVTAEVINDKIVADQGGETVAVTLRDPDMKVLAADPERIAGVTVRKSGMLVMVDRRISTPLSTGLTNYWQALRDATAGWQIQQVAPGAAPVKLAGEQGHAAPDVMTTIDNQVQLRLEDTAVEVAQPAAVMVFDAKSGGVLGMALNDAATDGRIVADVAYPTGSTLDPVFGALDATMKNQNDATAQLHSLGLGLTFTVPGVVAPNDSSGLRIRSASFRPQDFTATMLNMGALGVAVAKGGGEAIAPTLIKGSPTKIAGGELGAIDPQVLRRVTAAMTATARTGDASDLTGASGLRALVGTNGPDGPGWFIGISGGKILVVYCEGSRSGTAALQVAQKYYRLS